MAGLSAGTITKADVVVFEPEVWEGSVNNFYRAKLMCGNFFWDLSAAVSQGGDQINIPNLTEMTANDKTNGAEVTLNSPTEDDVNLVINTWKEVSFLIEDFEARQVAAVYDLQEKYAMNAGYTAAAALEDALITLTATAFTSQALGGSTITIVDSHIRRAIQYLDDVDAPQEDRAFFFAPSTMWDDVMALDKFVLANESGGRGPVTSGPVGMLYGYKVNITSRIPTTLGSVMNFFAHKDSIAHAGSKVRIQSNYVPERLGTLVTADLMYGVITNRSTSGVLLKAAA
jgi:hypothetical protein